MVTSQIFSQTQKVELHHIFSKKINSMWKMKGNRWITLDSSVSPCICKLINHPYNIILWYLHRLLESKWEVKRGHIIMYKTLQKFNVSVYFPVLFSFQNMTVALSRNYLMQVLSCTNQAISCLGPSRCWWCFLLTLHSLRTSVCQGKLGSAFTSNSSRRKFISFVKS